MAIAFQYLEKIFDLNLLSKGQKILDIGCSNLYGASEEKIIRLADRFNGLAQPVAQDLAARSAEKSAFAGELIEKLGVGYEAIDFAEDYKTTKFDLNHDKLPRNFLNAFDLVVNFGTTEHVINQAHAFNVIHDAVKPGGYIYHQLPASGFFNHCYFLYTGRFFFDLAGYNNYEVAHCWLDQAEPSDFMASIRDYSSYFPALQAVQPVEDAFMRDTCYNVIYKKPHNERFKYPMELSTAYSKPKTRLSPLPMLQKIKNLIRSAS